MENEGIIEEEVLEIEGSNGKRKIRKGPVTFHIKLTEEQKKAKETALNNVVTFFRGSAGCAKTTLCVNVALDHYIKGHVDRIIFIRPTIEAGESQLGFMPGDQEDKMQPYMRPMMDALYTLRDKNEIDKMLEKKKIQILPIQFARGLNIKDAVVICDEMQNASISELQLITSRICDNTKVLITMDEKQCDMKNKSKSCSKHIDKLSKLEGVAIVDLTENFRHPLATLITETLNEV